MFCVIVQPAMTSAANNPSYGTGEDSGPATAKGASGDNPRLRNRGSDASDTGHDADMLEDIDDHKDVYRMKVLFYIDLSLCSHQFKLIVDPVDW